MMCMLVGFPNNYLSSTAMFQNDRGRFLNITNRKLLYADVIILDVVHYRGYHTNIFVSFNVEVS